jgi:hypothetical protein
VHFSLLVLAPSQAIPRLPSIGRCFSKPEVFFNGEPLQLARWPNVNSSSSYWEWAQVASAPDPATSFTLATDGSSARNPVSAARLRNWSEEQNLWFHGYWAYDWADSYKQLASINLTTGLITTVSDNSFLESAGAERVWARAIRDKGTAGLEAPHLAYPTKSGARAMAVNALCELDVPGEYYIDSATGLLLFLSPREDGTVRETDNIVISVNESAIELQHGIKNADGNDSPAPLRFEGLTIGYALSSAVNVAVYTADQEDPDTAHAGVYGTASVVFSNCTILNSGQTAAKLSGNGFGANRLLIQNSLIKNAGCGGAMLGGGDGSWLTPSGVVLDGNQFSDLNRRKRTDKPAVAWTGVGHVVRNNVVASSPHAAFMGTGNDCLFEGNTLRNSAYEVECVQQPLDDSVSFSNTRPLILRTRVFSDH